MSTAQQAVIAVMNEVSSVAKTGKNTAQGFNFRGIDAVMNAVGPAFRKHGAFVVPTVIGNTADTVPSKNGGSLNVVRLNVEFAIYGQEGDPIVGSVASEAFDSGDKATAKAMSVALRTFLLQVLCLPTDEPDPDSQSYELAAIAPSVNQLKAAIAQHFRGKPTTAITEALTVATGKSTDWSVEELQAYLDTLGSKK
jgi:hypothetical protein